MMVLSPFVHAQITPSWVNQVQSTPAPEMTTSSYGNIPRVCDVLYSGNNIYSCGMFNGVKSNFGSLVVHSDTNRPNRMYNSTDFRNDYLNGFVASADMQGNYQWVKMISYSNIDYPDSLLVSPSSNNYWPLANTAYRICKGEAGNIYVTGSVIADSVFWDKQLIYTPPRVFVPNTPVSFPYVNHYLIKISPSGQLLWSRFWKSGEGSAIINAFATNGKIVVHELTGGLDYQGITFGGSSGIQGWTIRFNPDGSFDGAGLLNPDPFSNTYLTSSFHSPLTKNAVVLKSLNAWSSGPLADNFEKKGARIQVFDSTLALVKNFPVYGVNSQSDTVIIVLESAVEDLDGNITCMAKLNMFLPISSECGVLVNGTFARVAIVYPPFASETYILFRLNKDGCIQWANQIQSIHSNGLVHFPNGSLAAIRTPDPFLVNLDGSKQVDSTSIVYYDQNGRITGGSQSILMDKTLMFSWNTSFAGSPEAFSRMSPTPDGFVGSYGRGFFRFQYPTYPPAGIDSVASISANGPLELCQGNSVTLTASNGTSYEWTPGSATTQSITVTQAGTYQVKIGLPGGCYGYTSVIVKVNAAPSVNAGPNRQAVMNTGNLQLAGTPAGGTWSGSGISPTGSFSTIVSPGTYGVRYDVTSGSCTASDSTFILILPMISEGVQSPVASVQGGTYSGPQNVTLSSATTGAQIYYTTSGNVPKVGTGFTKLYTGPVAIIQNTTLKAIAMKDGEKDSPLMTQVYTIQNPGIAGTPVISPANGTFSSIQLVTITSSTPGADIYFTTNGNLPLIGTPNSFTRKYTTPFAVSQTTTIKAIAIKDGILNSAYSQATLTFATPAVTQPVQFSPAPGLHAGPVSVTMSSATPEAAIYYTTNGNVPRTDIPNFFTRLYSSPLNLSVSTSIRAVAVKSGLASSSVALAVYTIGGGFREATDIESMEVYPNPTTGNVQVQLPASETDGILTVINLQGKELQRMELRKAEKETTLSLESYPAGLYRIQLRNASGLQSLTVMKQ
ncbi:MAG TPA: chitobiase/beta-hexosaminidase C-terminal domain-containing protein [Catalimonadaceae bacterium]|nr:chitobiase/beta-hexosaminidase C-terminal domain-containing protein [Catalimonadaceae bacterium]